MPRSSAIAAVIAVSVLTAADEPGDQDVAAVLDVGDDPLLALDSSWRLQAFLFRGGLVFALVLLQPPARGHVDHVAVDVGVLPPAPADVGHPDRRGVAVGEAEERPIRRPVAVASIRPGLAPCWANR